MIEDIDIAVARAMPGVNGVFTAADLDADGIGTLPCIARVATVSPMIMPPRRALARDRVRHVGDPVAFVVADTVQQARDAAERIAVVYRPLPAVVDAREALAARRLRCYGTKRRVICRIGSNAATHRRSTRRSRRQVPGLAVAVVQNGEVVLVRAHGLRDIEAGLKVTPDTQFLIGSVTKSFTATGLALLMDERCMDWKKPVREYLPEFRLHDAVATDRVTVRDLLCHHSGLLRHDWIWMPGDLSPAQMLAAMRYLGPSDGIRSTHQYSNLGYLVASIVTERVSGQSWTEITRARLTDKLHMNVTFTVEDPAAAADASVPYWMDGDTRLRVKRWPIRATAAGGINTSIASFANWLRLHLDKGTFEGQRLLLPTLIQQLQTPRVHVSAPAFGEYSDVHYGLGFRSHWYRGERVVWHTGGWIGWSTLMTMLPDRGVGVAVFTNRDPSAVLEILANYVYDRVCGKEPIPWLDRYRERRRKTLAQIEIDRQARKATRRLNTRPSHDIADYAGDYDHPGYGRITITHAEGKLSWAYRGMSEPLAHRHYDTFELPEVPGRLFPDRLAISFFADREGNIASLAATFEPLVQDIVFTRIPAGDCTNPAFRQRCIGTISYGGTTVVIGQDNDGQLTLTIGSQPTYKFPPYQGRTFIIDELEGFRVEFHLGPDGEVDELIFHQPNGTFVARRAQQDAVKPRCRSGMPPDLAGCRPETHAHRPTP